MTNLIANATNLIANGTNSIAKVMNSIAKVTNSIAKTCNNKVVLVKEHGTCPIASVHLTRISINTCK